MNEGGRERREGREGEGRGGDGWRNVQREDAVREKERERGPLKITSYTLFQTDHLR